MNENDKNNENKPLGLWFFDEIENQIRLRVEQEVRVVTGRVDAFELGEQSERALDSIKQEIGIKIRARVEDDVKQNLQRLILNQIA